MWCDCLGVVKQQMRTFKVLVCRPLGPVMLESCSLVTLSVQILLREALICTCSSKTNLKLLCLRWDSWPLKNKAEHKPQHLTVHLAMQAQKVAAILVLVCIFLAAPSAAQYGYGSYGYGSYSVGRRLFADSQTSDSMFAQPESFDSSLKSAHTGRALLQAYGAYSYGYGGSYGTGRRLLQAPSYGYGYGYGY